MNTEEYQGNYFNHEKTFDELAGITEKKQRGGMREGAGRKREYDETTVRLKCSISVSRLANVFISILDKFSKYATYRAFECRLDGKEVEWKGRGRRRWSDADAIKSPFSIRIKDGSFDEKIFLLAFKIIQPQGVAFSGFWQGMGEVTLRWQRADEVARVMMEYGRLYAMRNRLSKNLHEAYNSMPESWMSEELKEWLDKPI